MTQSTDKAHPRFVGLADNAIPTRQLKANAVPRVDSGLRREDSAALKEKSEARAKKADTEPRPQRRDRPHHGPPKRVDKAASKMSSYDSKLAQTKVSTTAVPRETKASKLRERKAKPSDTKKNKTPNKGKDPKMHASSAATPTRSVRSSSMPAQKQTADTTKSQGADVSAAGQEHEKEDSNSSVV